MKKRFRGFPAIILVILIVGVIELGCRENTLISSKVSPSSNTDSVYSVTLPLITHTYFVDSAVTSTNIGGVPIYQAVGTMLDPYFGTMIASTYFQVIPLDPDTDVYIGQTIDSATLVLPYSGFTYGSTAIDSSATFQVFYMDDTMNLYNTYYSFSNKAIDANFPLSAPTTLNISHLDDSILVSGPDHSGLRIPINVKVLMGHIYPALQAIETSTSPYQLFTNLFGGICVRPVNTTQMNTAMPYFELDGVDNYSEAGILVYYHQTGAGSSVTGDTDQIEPYYFNTGICGHFNNVTKAYTQYPVNNLVHSTQPNDQVIALQNQPGPNIDIIIPGIKSLPAGLINKAEIQLTLLPQSQYNDTTLFIYPESLNPLGIATDTYHPLGTTYAGEPYTVYDRYPITSTTPLTILDGTMHPVPVNNPTRNTFTIDIPREVIASMAAGNDTLHYHISGTSDYYGAFHMVAGGGAYGVNGTSDTLYRAKLFVVYSRLNKN